jgi:hypothetical protein
MNKVSDIKTFACATHPAEAGAAVLDIGRVIDIAGSSSQVQFDAAMLAVLAGDPDPSIAMGGQVGSLVKMRLGALWLVANVRSLRSDPDQPERIFAYVDFLGEGNEDAATGELTNFRRGVTRYPVPGCRVFPVSSADMRQMYSAADRPHTRPPTFADRCTSTRCSAGISRWSDRPAPANRHPPR